MIDKTMFFGSLGLAVIVAGLSISSSVYYPNKGKEIQGVLYHQSRFDEADAAACGNNLKLISLPVPEAQLNRPYKRKTIVAS